MQFGIFTVGDLTEDPTTHTTPTEHQRIKATADKAALRALVEKYGTRINTRWRDEVLARLKALSLPQAIATIPPELSPVLDANGKIVDAKATQTTSLAAYVEALEKASTE